MIFLITYYYMHITHTNNKQINLKKWCEEEGVPQQPSVVHVKWSCCVFKRELLLRSGLLMCGEPMFVSWAATLSCITHSWLNERKLYILAAFYASAEVLWRSLIPDMWCSLLKCWLPVYSWASADVECLSGVWISCCVTGLHTEERLRPSQRHHRCKPAGSAVGRAGGLLPVLPPARHRWA